MKITAVVVTNNRLSDLKVCINALHSQTYPLERIIVVNNGSIDGTFEWLKLQPEIEALHQTNLGSAGGQHSGISKAYELGADFVFSLDDDCNPARDCLERLVAKYRELNDFENWVLTSYTRDPDTNQTGPLMQVLPGVPAPPTKVYFNECELPISAKQNQLFENWGHFFLGVLIPRPVLSKVGYPDTRYFIRGEDYEYLLRCLRAARVGVVLNSVMWHPMKVDAKDKTTLLDWKLYFQLRNQLYINRKYFPSIRNSVVSRFLRLISSLLQGVFLGKGVDRLEILAYLDAIMGRFDRPLLALKK